MKNYSFWPLFLLWIFGLLIYPIWLAFSSFTTRLIVYIGLLVLAGAAGYLLHRWTSGFPEQKNYFIKDKYWKILLWVGFAYFLIQIPFLTQDLPPLSDESFHISRGVWLIEPLATFSSQIGIDYFLAFRIFAVLLLGILLLARKKIAYAFGLVRRRLLLITPVLLLGYFFLANKIAVAYHAIKFGTPVLDHLNWLTYYGPVSAVLYGLEFSFFGYSEFGMRIIQPFFIIGAALYLYQLLALRLEQKVACAASILFMFSPIIFYFASLSYLEAGQLFFLVAASYYFVRSRVHSNLHDIITSFFFITAGFMYKQPVLFLLPVFAAYLLLEGLLQMKWKLWNIIKKNAAYVYGLLFALAGIGPLLIINVLFDVRHTGDLGVWSQWLSLKAWTVYAGLIPRQTNTLILVLFILGFLFAIWNIFKRNSKETSVMLYLVVWFVVWYLIHMSYIILAYRPVRIMVPYIPAVIGLSVMVFHTYRKNRKIVSVLLLLVIAFTATFTLTLAYTDYQKRYVPVDEMFAYISEEIPADMTILATTAPHPYGFYSRKYQIHNRLDYTSWKPYAEQTPENLAAYMKARNISYAMFIAPRPNYYDLYPSDHAWNEYQDCAGRAEYREKKKSVPDCPLNAQVVKELEDGHPGFELVHSTDNGSNKMLLFRIA